MAPGKGNNLSRLQAVYLGKWTLCGHHGVELTNFVLMLIFFYKALQF